MAYQDLYWDLFKYTGRMDAYVQYKCGVEADDVTRNDGHNQTDLQERAGGGFIL